MNPVTIGSTRHQTPTQLAEAAIERAIAEIESGDFDGIDREAYSEIATAGPGNA